MATQLKTLLNTACAELNIAQQTAFISSSVNDAVQLLALANAAGLELMKSYDWTQIQTEYRFTVNFLTTAGIVTPGSAVVTGISNTSALSAGGLLPAQWQVASSGVPQDTYILSVDSMTQVTLTQAANSQASGVSQAINFGQVKYALPADFDRIIDRTMWDKSKHWEMMGPSTPQQWQWLKSGYISTGPRIRWRRLAGFFQIWPQINAAEYLGYEYISNNWCLSSGGTVQSLFALDTDTCIFDDRLFITLVKKKYLGAKGLDTAAISDELNRIYALRTSEERGSPMLSMAPRLTEVLIGVQNIPDGGYGQ